MTAAYNRAKMPQVRAFVDQIRELFGSDQVKVTWARENGIELGKKSNYSLRGENERIQNK